MYQCTLRHEIINFLLSSLTKNSYLNSPPLSLCLQLSVGCGQWSVRSACPFAYLLSLIYVVCLSEMLYLSLTTALALYLLNSTEKLARERDEKFFTEILSRVLQWKKLIPSDSEEQTSLQADVIQLSSFIYLVCNTRGDYLL